MARNWRAFWRGFVDAFADPFGLRHISVRYRTIERDLTGIRSDIEAMRGDWEAVGRDMRRAMDRQA